MSAAGRAHVTCSLRVAWSVGEGAFGPGAQVFGLLALWHAARMSVSALEVEEEDEMQYLRVGGECVANRACATSYRVYARGRVFCSCSILLAPIRLLPQ